MKEKEINIDVVDNSENPATLQNKGGIYNDVQTAMILAKKFPRDENMAMKRIFDACRRLEFADGSRYVFPRGNKEVSGPSVVFARELARLWGNIRYGFDIIADDDKAMTIRGWAWDIETNNYTSMDTRFEKLIYRKKDGWVIPKDRDLRELVNRNGAIVQRNVLLELFPKYIIDEAMFISKKTVIAKIDESKEKTMQKILLCFDSIGITNIMLDNYIERKTNGNIAKLTNATSEEIADLRDIYTSIIDGNSNKWEYFTIETKPEDNTKDLNFIRAGKETEHQGHDFANKNGKR